MGNDSALSPYVDSGPVAGADFYGREVLIGEIVAERQRAFCILGTRQIGKTSLLRQVKNYRPAILLDIQFAGGDIDLLSRQLCREVRKGRGALSWLPDQEVLADEDLIGQLTVLNDCSERAGTRLWVLIDEVEGMLDMDRVDSRFLHRLRGVVQNCPALRTVVVAAKNICQFNQVTIQAGMSPFLSGFAIRYLGGLSVDEAKLLLQQVRHPRPVATDDTLISHLMDLTNGHPLLLQLCGQRLFQEGRLRWPSENDSAHVFQQIQHAGVFEKDFEYLTEGERRILIEVLHKGAVETAVFPGILTEGLIGLGYLKRVDEHLRIGNQFFEWWLRETLPHSTSRIPEGSTKDMYKQSYFQNAHAVVIGVGDYDTPQFASLPATVRDAQAIVAVLTDSARCGYSPGNVHLITGEDAAAPNIRSALQALAQTTNPQSTALVYFSGHGGRRLENGIWRPYLCPREASVDNMAHTAISGDEFSSLLAAIPARKLLVIIDACHAGGTVELKGADGATAWKAGLPTDYYEALGQGSGRLVIASCKEDQVSRIRGVLSLFTYHLLEALGGKAAVRGDGLVHVLDVFHYVNEAVSNEEPQQVPILKAKDLDLNFPIALDRGGKGAGSGPTVSAIGAIREQIVRNPAVGAKALSDFLANRPDCALKRTEVDMKRTELEETERKLDLFGPNDNDRAAKNRAVFFLLRVCLAIEQGNTQD